MRGNSADKHLKAMMLREALSQVLIAQICFPQYIERYNETLKMVLNACMGESDAA